MTCRSDMPVKDYRAYAASPKGQAARQRARQRYIDKRRAANTAKPATASTAHLASLLSNWSRK